MRTESFPRLCLEDAKYVISTAPQNPTKLMPLIFILTT
jgi:hypothetical protein